MENFLESQNQTGDGIGTADVVAPLIDCKPKIP
jgi:hypothetical protein